MTPRGGTACPPIEDDREEGRVFEEETAGNGEDFKNREISGTRRLDVVFDGFPVGWYREPSIIDTFMEAYDFTGKTVIPFVASSMNGIGDSGKNTRALTQGAEVLAGKRFDANAAEKEFDDWGSQWV